MSYKKMNEIVSDSTYNNGAFYPGGGLYVYQMKQVLDALGIPYFDRDYQSIRESSCGINNKFKFSYQSYVYSGVETGVGALLNFRVGRNPATPVGVHALPFFGHTFNKDTWVADADSSYFGLTREHGYFRSDAWAGDFLLHDDNHGFNYTLPRTQLDPERVDYVCAIHAPGDRLDPMLAEVLTLHLLKVYMGWLDQNVIWNKELVDILTYGCGEEYLQAMVLRTTMTTPTVYVDNLRLGDGLGNQEDQNQVCVFQKLLTQRHLVVVEVSLPQLFPANRHRIAEFVFDASVDAKGDIGKALEAGFLFARFPGMYVLTGNLSSVFGEGRLFSSKLTDHIELL